jgi:hypothetical protein
MLEAAGRAEGIKFAAEGKEGFRFFPTDENVHYKYDVELFPTAVSKVKPKVKEIKGREPVAVATVGSGTDPFGRHGNGFGDHHQIHTRELGTTTSMTTYRGATRPSINHLNWFGTKAHPYAGYITKEKFDILSKYGCTWCQKDLEFGDIGVTIFETDAMVLCADCSGHEVVDDQTPNRIYVNNQAFNELR